MAEHPVLAKMNALIQGWETIEDRRRFFLQCYRMMTQNIIAASAAGYFEDNAWVQKLLENFAGYYFIALDAFECGAPTLPSPWQIAFHAAQEPRHNVIQHLFLGINAHINYDLVFTISDLLRPEWDTLADEMRQLRYRDHCRVNEIIFRTIDPVQDQVVEKAIPIFALIDTIFGPLDEWLASKLISQWREEVWQNAVSLVASGDSTSQMAITLQVEQNALKRAQEFI